MSIHQHADPVPRGPEFERVRAHLDRLVTRHVIAKTANDVLTYTISFTVSHMVARELSLLETARGERWWPMVATVIVTVIALIPLAWTSGTLARIDRQREMLRERLKIIDMKYVQSGGRGIPVPAQTSGFLL